MVFSLQKCYLRWFSKKNWESQILHWSCRLCLPGVVWPIGVFCHSHYLRTIAVIKVVGKRVKIWIEHCPLDFWSFQVGTCSKGQVVVSILRPAETLYALKSLHWIPNHMGAAEFWYFYFEKKSFVLIHMTKFCDAFTELCDTSNIL